MPEQYYIYNMDLLIGTVTKHEGDNVTVNVTCKRDCFRLEQFKLYMGLDTKSKTEWGDVNLFGVLVTSRIFDAHRVDIRSILSMLHLTEYDPWKIFVATEGMCVDDCIWISKSPRVGYTFFKRHVFGQDCLEEKID